MAGQKPRIHLVYSVHQYTPDWRRISHFHVLASADDAAKDLGKAVKVLKGLEVIVDSGGYRLISSGRLPDPGTVLKVQSILVDELGAKPVSLDHPVKPGTPTDQVEKANRWTARIARRWMKVFGDNFILPVHAHTPSQLDHALEIAREELGQLPDTIGLGSLAPLARTRPSQILQLLRHARHRIPVELHVFGVGNSLAAAIALEQLADTIDTSSPLQDARYGLARHPQTLQMVLVAPRKARGRPRAAPEEIARHCTCPTCRSNPKTMAEWGRRGLEARAIHNAYQLKRVLADRSLAEKLAHKRIPGSRPPGQTPF